MSVLLNVVRREKQLVKVARAGRSGPNNLGLCTGLKVTEVKLAAEVQRSKLNYGLQCRSSYFQFYTLHNSLPRRGLLTENDALETNETDFAGVITWLINSESVAGK